MLLLTLWVSPYHSLGLNFSIPEMEQLGKMNCKLMHRFTVLISKLKALRSPEVKTNKQTTQRVVTVKH